jgi:hypothetical protein
MKKPLDYEELWDSFTEEERRALLSNLPPHITRYDAQLHKQWRFLDVTLRIELSAVDWEFSLGRRFASRA